MSLITSALSHSFHLSKIYFWLWPVLRFFHLTFSILFHIQLSIISGAIGRERNPTPLPPPPTPPNLSVGQLVITLNYEMLLAKSFFMRYRYNGPASQSL